MFYQMITSTSTSVAPAVEVARLTLISSSNEAAIRRKSVSKDFVPPTSNDLPLGLLDDSDSGAEDAKKKPPTLENEVNHSEDKQNEAKPQEGDNNAGANKDSIRVSTIETSESLKTNGEEAPLEPEQRKTEPTPPAVPNPPSQPPPSVPPKYNIEPTIQDEVEFGAQQDVTEVINNVLFQMQCAMRPSDIDADGEQHDIITE